MAGPSVLIVDVDGVVSPVHGATAWGDDLIAGLAFGPVLVSPTLTAELDFIATTPGLTCLWLTSWPSASRAGLDPFPGRTWDTLAEPPDGAPRTNGPGSSTGVRLGWWKWSSVESWLAEHPAVRTLVWCDDELDTDADAGLEGGDERQCLPASRVVTRLEVIGERLAARGIDATLLAPDTRVGLTPDHVVAIRRALRV